MKKPKIWTEELEEELDQLILSDNPKIHESPHYKNLMKWKRELTNPRTPIEKLYDKNSKRAFDRMMKSINEYLKIQKDFSNGK